MTVRIVPMAPADALEIQRQPSQRVQLGLVRAMTQGEAEDLAFGGEAWTAWRDDAPIACFGLRETFPGAQAVAWAILSIGIGTSHLAITRFARARIRQSPLPRIEAIVKADVPAEGIWARCVGMTAAHVLRRFGAASEDHILFERIA